jgi:hypothetical protein
MHKPATINPSFVLREPGGGVTRGVGPGGNPGWETGPGIHICPDCGGGVPAPASTTPEVPQLTC